MNIRSLLFAATPLLFLMPSIGKAQSQGDILWGCTNPSIEGQSGYCNGTWVYLSSPGDDDLVAICESQCSEGATVDWNRVRWTRWSDLLAADLAAGWDYRGPDTLYLAGDFGASGDTPVPPPPTVTPPAAPSMQQFDVSFFPPTTRSDGSELTNFASFRVYWGETSGGPYPNSADVGELGSLDLVVPNATWYVVATAVDTSGQESAMSDEAIVVRQ